MGETYEVERYSSGAHAQRTISDCPPAMFNRSPFELCGIRYIPTSQVYLHGDQERHQRLRSNISRLVEQGTSNYTYSHLRKHIEQAQQGKVIRPVNRGRQDFRTDYHLDSQNVSIPRETAVNDLERGERWRTMWLHDLRADQDSGQQ